MSDRLPLRVLVCDDELMARKRITRLLGEVGGVEAIVECESGDQVLERLATDDVDLAILDVQMPGRSGIETVMAMPEERPYVVFLTAHPEHAVRAFDVGAVDYLLKPLDAPRLSVALDRARRFIDAGGREIDAGDAPQARIQKLAIASRGGVELVAPSDVSHATFDGSLVTVHTKARELLTDDSLQDLEQKLAGTSFVRVHRRALLNLDHVERLESIDTGGYVARLSSGKKVDVSRQSARRLRRLLGLR